MSLMSDVQTAKSQEIVEVRMADESETSQSSASGWSSSADGMRAGGSLQRAGSSTRLGQLPLYGSSGNLRQPKSLVVPTAVQQQEHYQQLLQQGKLRQGSIIKKQKSTALPPGEEVKATYVMKERESLGEKWVFIVNGLRVKEWEKKCGKLLKQLSLVEVCCCSVC